MKNRSTLVTGLLVWSLFLLLAGIIGYQFAPQPDSNIPDDILKEVQQRFGLSPNLVRAVILVESGGRPQVRSKRGAVGLMQLLPSTAQEVARMLRDPLPPNLEDPVTNIRLGSFYLARLLVRYHGDLPLALAAYNAGPGAIDRILRDHPTGGSRDLIEQYAPEETQAYVRKVLQTRKTLDDRKSSNLYKQ